MSKIKIGIYGGTFSPPHFGHISAAKSFIDGVSLDKLLIMPDFIPPHKDDFGNVSAEDRLNMCRIAFAGIPKTEVSDYEILRGEKSYTYLTLEAFRREDVDLYFLCGTDMFLTLNKWKYPERIFSSTTICFVKREFDKEIDAEIKEKTKFYEDKFSARIIQLTHNVYPTSSSELRQKILDESEIPTNIPKDVYEYIKKRGLYK